MTDTYTPESRIARLRVIYRIARSKGDKVWMERLQAKAEQIKTEARELDQTIAEAKEIFKPK